MKISSRQVRAALAAYVEGKATRADGHAALGASTGGTDAIGPLEHRLRDMPDERDTVVHELRRKIRHGRYYVSSRDIVDALLGRLAAQLLAED